MNMQTRTEEWLFWETLVAEEELLRKTIVAVDEPVTSGMKRRWKRLKRN